MSPARRPVVVACLLVGITLLDGSPLAASTPRASSVSDQALQFSDRALKLTLPAEDPCTLIVSRLGSSAGAGELRWSKVMVDQEKLLLGMCGYLQSQLIDWAGAELEDLTQLEARQQQFGSTVEAAKRELMNHFLSWVAELAHGQLLPSEQSRFDLADPATRQLLASEWLARPETEIQTYVLVFLERQSGPLAHLLRDYVEGSSMEIWGGLKGLHDDAAGKLQRFLQVSDDVKVADTPYAEALLEHGFDGPWVEQFQAWEGQIRTLDDGYSVVEAGQIIVAAFRTDRPREKIAGLFELLAVVGDSAGASRIPIVSFFGDVVSAYAAVAQEMLRQIEGLEGQIRTREGYCVGLATHAMSDERDQDFRARFGDGIRACPATLTTLPFKNIYLQAQPDDATQLYFWVNDHFVAGQPQGGGLPAVRRIMGLISHASDLAIFTRFSQDAHDLDVVSRIYNTSYASEHGVAIPGLLTEAETTIDGIAERLGALARGLDPFGPHACSGDALHAYVAARVDGRVPSHTELVENRGEYLTRFAMRTILAQHRGLGSAGPRTMEQLWHELHTLSLLQIRGAVRAADRLTAPCARCGGALLSISLSDAEQLPGCELSSADSAGGFVLHLLTRSPGYQLQIYASAAGVTGPAETVDARVVSGTSAVPFVARLDPLLLGVPLPDEDQPEEGSGDCNEATSRLAAARSKLATLESQLARARALIDSAASLPEGVAATAELHRQTQDAALAVIEAKQLAEGQSARICAAAEALAGNPAADEGARVRAQAEEDLGALDETAATAERAFARAAQSAEEAATIFGAVETLPTEAAQLQEKLQELADELQAVRQVTEEAVASATEIAARSVPGEHCATSLRAAAEAMGHNLDALQGQLGSLGVRAEGIPGADDLAHTVAIIENTAADARAAADTAEIYLEAVQHLVTTAQQCLGTAAEAPDPALDDAVELPAVEGLELAVARDILHAAGLQVQLVAGSPAAREEDAATIHSQQPSPGTVVERGAVVVLGVRGPFSLAATVPDVRNHLVDDARALLAAAGLGSGLAAGEPAASPELEGTVEIQIPPPGVTVESGAVVSLTIRGPHRPVATVPDVLDHYLANAKAMLQAASLGFSISAGPPAETREQEGTIRSQQPVAGEVVEQGSVVVLRVRGAVGDGVAVPAVTGIATATARATLRAAGLAAVEQESGTARSAAESDTVAAQDPPAGARVQPGSAVTLFVLRPHRPVVDPPPPPAQRRWVLVSTVLNPTNDQLSKHLAGSSYINNTVSERSLSFGVTGDGPENFVIRADFEPPPPTLVPGSAISLRARVSGRGAITYSYATFVYGAVLGNSKLGESSYKIDARLAAGDVLLSFTAPPADQQELRIIATFAWTSGTRVDWVYRAQ